MYQIFYNFVRLFTVNFKDLFWFLSANGALQPVDDLALAANGDGDQEPTEPEPPKDTGPSVVCSSKITSEPFYVSFFLLPVMFLLKFLEDRIRVASNPVLWVPQPSLPSVYPWD